MGIKLDVGISEIYKKHSSGMHNLGSSQEWINLICTKYAIICQYKPHEPEKTLNVLTDYLCFWRDTYYLPAEPVISEQAQKLAIENILRFKTLLLANDAGLEIYLKKFGKGMLAVIESAAFGSDPALNNNTDVEIEKSNLLEQSSSATGDIVPYWLQ